MRGIFACLLGAVLLSGCSYLDSFGSMFGPRASEVIAAAEDKSMEETAERVEDLCSALTQQDIDAFIAGVNARADRNPDGTYPGLADQAINCARQ